MILVLQIAAGIVLAYLIIRFRHTAWALAVGLLSIVAIIAVVAGLGAGASYVAEANSINWAKVVTFVSVIPVLGLAGIGAYGLLTLFRIAFRTERPSTEGDGCFPVLGLFALMNMLILAAASAAVEAMYPDNPISRVAGAVNDWSRATGHKDLGSMLFGTAMMALWPWLIFAAIVGLARIRKLRIAPNDQSNEDTV